jgi:hypothetical protein
MGSWASLGVVGAAALTAEFGRTALPEPPAESADATGPEPATC